MSTLYRIVQAFDNIVNSLIQQENFNNISVVERDLALRGDRVGLCLLICPSKHDAMYKCID